MSVAFCYGKFNLFNISDIAFDLLLCSRTMFYWRLPGQRRRSDMHLVCYWYKRSFYIIGPTISVPEL